MNIEEQFKLEPSLVLPMWFCIAADPKRYDYPGNPHHWIERPSWHEAARAFAKGHVSLKNCYADAEGVEKYKPIGDAKDGPYYPPRFEHAILNHNPIPTAGRMFIEWGPGEGDKLVEIIAQNGLPEKITLIDHSDVYLKTTIDKLVNAGMHPEDILCIHGDFFAEGMARDSWDSINLFGRDGNGKHLAHSHCMFGGTLGNFPPQKMREFLTFIRRTSKDGDHAYFGVDNTMFELPLLFGYSQKHFYSWIPHGVAYTISNVLGFDNLNVEQLYYEPEVVRAPEGVPERKIREADVRFHVRNAAEQELYLRVPDNMDVPQVYRDAWQAPIIIPKNFKFGLDGSMRFNRDFIRGMFKAAGWEIERSKPSNKEQPLPRPPHLAQVTADSPYNHLVDHNIWALTL